MNNFAKLVAGLLATGLLCLCLTSCGGSATAAGEPGIYSEVIRGTINLEVDGDVTRQINQQVVHFARILIPKIRLSEPTIVQVYVGPRENEFDWHEGIRDWENFWLPIECMPSYSNQHGIAIPWISSDSVLIPYNYTPEGEGASNYYTNGEYAIVILRT